MNREQNNMDGNLRLRSALIMILIILSSHAVSNENLSNKVEILSPQPSEQYFENVDIQFQIEAEDSRVGDIHKKACGEGFTRRQNCEPGFQKIYAGQNTGRFRFALPAFP